MKFSYLLIATAMIASLGSTAHASNLVRTVDSFDFLIDYSGSMMMKEKTTNMAKMELAKDVVIKVNNEIPNLGYMSSIHTAAPAATLLLYADWDVIATNVAIKNLETDLPIFGRQTPLGDSIASFAKDYSAMDRPTAIILVSDGLNNLSYSPVKEAELIIKTQPGTCFHVISFADTEEGLATLKEIAALSKCSVMVNGIDLYNSPKAVEDFVADVFYDDLMGDALVLRGINFAFDSAALSAKSEGILDEVATLLNVEPSQISLEGWTDSIGSKTYNQVLSTRRANSVKGYLAKQGVPVNNMKATGMGESSKYDNRTRDGRFLNRRVEVLIGK